MARRLVISSGGLRISAPGYDALSTTADHLVFATDLSRLHLMQVGSGTFTLPAGGIGILFSRPLGGPPLVRCGVTGFGGVGYPVNVTVDQYGFVATPGSAPDGSSPAVGAACTWVAFMRARP